MGPVFYMLSDEPQVLAEDLVQMAFFTLLPRQARLTNAVLVIYPVLT